MFWRNKRVFVTGHTGFKGSWLSLWLQERGAQVTGFSLQPPSEPNLFELARVAEGMVSFTGDVRDLAALRDAIVGSRPEIIFHLAAQSLVRPSYEDPIDTYATNVMGTANVLECVRGLDYPAVAIIVTSDKCYENREWPWGYREIEPMGGFDPYSSSKGCAELITAAYRRSYFPPQRFSEHRKAVASVRAGNVIGGGDWATDRLVPDLMRAFLQGQPVTIRNPAAIRPWQHVLDPLAGYLRLAEMISSGNPGLGDAWNFGPEEQDVRPVAWIVAELKALWGEGKVVYSPDSRLHEASLLKLDSSKAREVLGWRPLLRAKASLDLTVEWYKSYAAGKDVRELTIRQVRDYLGLCPQGQGVAPSA
jgi:CDP-glucose 4,6-dehydratase